MITAAGQARDWSALRVLVPTYTHAQSLKSALLQIAGAAFVPPRIVTLSGWCALLPPPAEKPLGDGARLMDLYAGLRQHAWLKKLFGARRNTDLLPLAQMLLTLSDELTQSLFPSIVGAGGLAEARWQQALQQLTPEARQLLSDEAQLVWSIWKSQLDGSDALAVRYRQTMRLAEQAHETLVWIAPAVAEPFDLAFLQAYGERQTVLPICLDWSAAAIAPAFGAAWPELCEEEFAEAHASAIDTPPQLALSPAMNMEQEAQRGAQTIVDWLQQGKANIAVIAQDRVVARRLRALLERSQIFVADETGWKLSTTRAASALAAWFDVVAARGETIALLDLLKSPFVFAGVADKEAHLMAIEAGLRNANVLGGWDAVIDALIAVHGARDLLATIAQQAAPYGGRKTIAQWGALTESTLRALDMWQALQDDAAGVQVLALLQAIVNQCEGQAQPFSFAEWRAFIGLQLESTSFLAPGSDRRVVMLPLNGAQLRRFDAVLVLGCDAEHLPSQPGETLFFANAVRRELGLATRESRQRQQLRDFAALLCCNGEVVLSWQTQRDGEPNPLSAWIERLQLVLQRAGAAALRQHEVADRAAQFAGDCADHAGPGSAASAAAKIIRQRLQQPGCLSVSIFCDAHAGLVRPGRIDRHAGKARLRRLAAQDFESLSRSAARAQYSIAGSGSRFARNFRRRIRQGSGRQCRRAGLCQPLGKSLARLPGMGQPARRRRLALRLRRAQMRKNLALGRW